MEKKLGINPWLTIWVRPRQTIRALVEYNVNFRILILCFIYGFQYLLQTSQFLALGQNTSLLMIILFSAILAIPVGYIIFNILSFFYFLLGKLIKGKGSFKQIRAATYWSSVPLIISVLAWIILMGVHGNNLFIPGYEKHLLGISVALNVAIGLVQVVIAVWAIIIFLHALGEVQGFSAWMALLNAFLAAVSLSAVLFLIIWGVSALSHVT